ncbi:MAG: hypothetical protein KJN76_04740 [Eudoraea sp.]|nr:hypothetical protein [Eudoraea sp.]
MMEDELIRIWQKSANQERIKFEKSKLMIELKSSLVRLHKWWKYLELIEVSSIIIGILSFIFVFDFVPYTTSKIASVFIIIFLINILIRLLGIKKFKPSESEENYLEYLKKTKDYLGTQKKLLATAIYWAVLPIYPIMLLFLIGFWEIPEKRYIIVITYLATVGMGIWGYFLNKNRIKNEIDPRINKVEALIKELEE